MSGRLDPVVPFAAELSEAGGTAIVTVTGELDLVTVPEVEALVAPVAPSDRLVLDLRAVSFMDSVGVRLLMVLDIRARAEGWTLVVARSPGPVGRLLELCRMPDRVAVVGDPSEVP